MSILDEKPGHVQYHSNMGVRSTHTRSILMLDQYILRGCIGMNNKQHQHSSYVEKSVHRKNRPLKYIWTTHLSKNDKGCALVRAKTINMYVIMTVGVVQNSCINPNIMKS